MAQLAPKHHLRPPAQPAQGTWGWSFFVRTSCVTVSLDDGILTVPVGTAPGPWLHSMAGAEGHCRSSTAPSAHKLPVPITSSGIKLLCLCRSRCRWEG